MSELLKINVNDHIEKKGNLSYLSWAWAWAEVLKIDPGAWWNAHEWADRPAMFLPDGTAMVKISVEVKGSTKTCVLPVMDNRNRAIVNPDAFAINTAIMRCLAKAMSPCSSRLTPLSAPSTWTLSPPARRNWPDGTAHRRMVRREAWQGHGLPRG